jgi:hypothetical protein
VIDRARKEAARIAVVVVQRAPGDVFVVVFDHVRKMRVMKMMMVNDAPINVEITLLHGQEPQ